MFHQEDKKLSKLLDTSEFRTLTHIEEKERDYRKVDQDKLKWHCIENDGFIVNPNKTVRGNSIMMMGD